MPNSITVREKQLYKATQVNTLEDHSALYPISEYYKKFIPVLDNPDVFAMIDIADSPNANFVAEGDWILEEIQEDNSTIGPFCCLQEDFNELYEEVNAQETLDKQLVFETIRDGFSHAFDSYDLGDKAAKDLIKIMEWRQNASI